MFIFTVQPDELSYSSIANLHNNKIAKILLFDIFL